jgi:autotransporter-associated beta strand protein
VTLNAGGALAPVGQLNISSLAWNGGTIDMSLGTSSSLLQISGNLLSGGTAAGGFVFTGTSGFALNTIYTLATVSGSDTFTLSQFSGNALDSVTPTFTISGSAVDVEFIPSAATGTAWKASPASGDWNTAGNWTSGTVPNSTSATAAFNTSSKTSVSLSGSAQVNGIVFNPGASAFTITAGPKTTLTISGTGIINNSAIPQNFVAGVDGAGNFGGIIFTNSATAGINTTFTSTGGTAIDAQGGYISFNNSSTAGSGTFANNGGTVGNASGGETDFGDTSTAGNATINNNGGTVINAFGGLTTFSGSATAGNATITDNGPAVSGAYGGSTLFYDKSSAGSGTFTNNNNTPLLQELGSIAFNNSSTAGNATFTNNGGFINFYDTSTAGNATFTNNGGIITFSGTSTAGSGTFTNNSGYTYFNDSSSNAGNATFTNNGGTVSGAAGGYTQFSFSATAGSGNFINNGGTVSGAIGGYTYFGYFNGSSATAGSGTFTNNGGTVSGAGGGATYFDDNSTSGNGTFINKGATAGGGATGGITVFHDNSSAGTGTFDNKATTLAGTSSFTIISAYNGALSGAVASGWANPLPGAVVYGVTGGDTYFYDTSNAASGSFTNEGAGVANAYGGGVVFQDGATALNATFTNDAASVNGSYGGYTLFIGTSTAGSGTFTSQGATVSGAGGGITGFGQTSTAGNATLIANGGTGGGLGGSILFIEDSTGGTATVEVFGNGALDISLHNSPGVGILSLEGTGQVFLGANNLAVGGTSGITIFSGTIQDGGMNGGTGGSLTASGPGTLTLSGANTFTGLTSVTGGLLNLSNSLALQNSTLATGGIVFDSSVSSHAFTIGGLSGSGNIALADNAVTPNAVALSIGNNNDSTTFSGTLSGGGSLTKTGTGTLTFSSSDTYTGGTKINGGVLQTQNTSALGTGGVTLNAGGALAPVGQLNISSLAWNGGTIDMALGTSSSLLQISGNLLSGGTAAGAFDFTNASGFALNTTYTLATVSGSDTFTQSQFSGNSVDGGTPTFILSGSAVDVEFIVPNTWKANPATGDWNTAGNWTSGTVPNSASATATFYQSATTSVSLSAYAQVNSIVFNPGGNAFTITASPTTTLNISGTGIINNSGTIQNFVTGVDRSGNFGSISFTNSATAGSNTAFTNTGGASIGAYGGETLFSGSSTAGNGTFTNNAGTVSSAFGGFMQFSDRSSAGSGTFTNSGATVSGATSGYMQFSGSSTADNGAFTNNGGTLSGAQGGETQFNDTSSAGNGTFTDNAGTVGAASGGSTQFNDTSSAGNGTFTNNAGAVSNAYAGSTQFSGSASAGNGVFTNNGGAVTLTTGGYTSFDDTSSAGNGTFSNKGGTVGSAFGGYTQFNNNSNAGNATFTNSGGSINGAYGGQTQFNDSSTAGSGTFTNNCGLVSGANGGYTQFSGSSSAGKSTITNNGGTVGGAHGGYTQFLDTSTGSNATITNNAGTVSGASGGYAVFNNTSSAGSGTLTNNGGALNSAYGGYTEFANSSTAGNATLIANSGSNGGPGGAIYFYGLSDGGTARVIANGNGLLDISALANPGMNIGSIEGSGNFFLGSETLTVGGNNLSTVVSGVIQDGGQSGGTGGAIIKTGTGVLTLSGSNTYTGGTTINGGVLQVGDGITAGASLGSGQVLVNSGGTLTLDLANGGTFANNVTNNNLVIFDDRAASNYTASGIISGTGSVIKSGANTVTLSGSNTYSGGTTINGGVLQTQNTSALGSGGVTLNAGGALAPVGQLNIGTLAWNGGTIDMALGTSSSLLQISGNLLRGGTAAGAFDFTNASGFALNTIYTLATVSGSDTFTQAQFSGNTLDGVTPTFTLSGRAVDVDFIQSGTAQIGLVSGTPGAPIIITGGTTAVSVTVSDNGTGTLNATVTGSNNVTGSSTLSVAASGTGSTGGLTYTGTAIGAAQQGTFVVSSTNASNSPVTGSVTVDVLGHSQPSLTLTAGNNQTVITGAAGITATLTLADGAGGTSGLSPLDVNSLGAGLSGTTGSAVVASGGSASYTASLSTATVGAGQQQVFSLNAGDEQSLSGASPLATQSGTMALNVFGHAAPVISGSALNLGYAHAGYASTITSANGITVTNGTSGAYIVNLSGSAPGAGNVTVNSVSGISAGNSAAVAATLAPGQGIGAINSSFAYKFADDSALPGASASLSTGTFTVTGEVYSGQSTWTGAGGGSWGTLAASFGNNWGTNQGSPGLDPNFTSMDTATFGNTVGEGTAIVTLEGAAPSLAAITFNNSNASYLIEQGTGTSDITLNGGTSNASIQDQAGSHAISAPLALETNVAVSVTRTGDVLTLSGPVSGAGGLVTSGSGTLVISGSNSYTGGTTIEAGNVQLGNSNALGSPANALAINGGTLDLKGFSVTVGALSGLNGGIITNNGAAGVILTVNSSSNSTFGGVIEDGASQLGVTKQGTGTLTLSGANTYTGGTTINGGLLEVNGSIAGNAVVNPGGTLGGVGTIGGNVSNNGGVVAPGDAPGTLTIGGNYTQSATGTLTIQIAGIGAGQFDVLAVGGTATLNGTLQLVRLNNFQYKAGETLLFLTAGGGVKGTFSNVNTGTILGGQLLYEGNVVIFEFTQGSFVSLATPGSPNFTGLTPNQTAVAANLDTVLNDPRAGALIGFLDNEPLGNLPNDFDLISPDQLTALYDISFSAANVQQGNLENRMQDIRNGSTGFVSRLSVYDLQGTVELGNDGKAAIASKDNDAFQPSPGNRWGMFVSGNGEFVNVNGDFNARGYDFTTGGITLGIDGRVNENLAIGVAIDYAHTWSDLTNGGSIEADSGRLGIYATWFQDGLYFNGYAGGGYSNFDTRRAALQGLAIGSTNGGEFDSFLTGGYDFHRGAWTFGPVFSLAYTYAGINGYTEFGSLAPLNIVSQGQDSVTTDFAWMVSYASQVGKAAVIPQFKAGWQHQYAYGALPIDSRFASGAGGVFTVHGPSVGRDSAVVEVGVNVQWNERMSGYLNYDAQVNDAYQSNSITGGVNISF